MGASIKELTWWNGSATWKYPISVNNTGNASILTYFQVPLNVTVTDKMAGNGSDFLIINDTDGVVQPMWIDYSNSINGSYINLWTNLSSIPASAWTNSTYYLYIVPNAFASNGTKTFVVFDDFEDGTIDSNKWSITTGGTGTVTESNGNLSLYAPSGVGNGARVKSTSNINIPYRIQVKTSISQLTNIYKLATIGINNINTVFAWAASSDYIGSQGTAMVIPLTANSVDYFIDGVSGTTFAETSTGFHNVDIRVPSTSITSLYFDGIWKYNSGAIGNNANPVAFKISGHDANGGADTRLNITSIFVTKYVSPEPTAQLGAAESPSPPSIISNSTYRTFTATWNQTVNVVWYWNSTSIQTNNSVTTASYTNSSLINGTHNITATGTNPNGNSSSITWLWTISPAQAGEAIREFIQVIMI
jgi:hypothetical protein